MTKKLYFDLLIKGEDITLDSGNQPVICDNRVSIAQDIKHALIESGLATLLIAERSRILRRDIILQMILIVEEDRRLVPGTIFIDEEDQGRLRLTAETYEFGKIENLGIVLND
ncbi:DUF2590 family protein [Pasteurella multocida]|uniref:DUF2590 family protein n=2 Tax=Irtavirus TaxID=2732981 RepID=A0AAE9WZS4_9CAUD|nr:DUF2590 family protein [Pasteurella multocida]YP_654745.1 DUF2590 family protein [Pasteurella phage F108]EGP03105.1 phage protein [Pasteurella multocida subsp. multocida str. Anand1_goat]WBY65463.1 hypothetical protein FP3_000032 [Pasteurella phage vB_PmuM_CFP3]AAZ93669.1 unknown [Pasteurella phage F108]ARA69451.1 hypothetical protein BTV67_02475 [Pasteurella multocida subsp. multocida]ARA89207.1 hypothetical protein BTV66_06235 [Pasteurella multocida subsp. septica]